MRHAPELKIQKWLNTDQPIKLESLRGKVVVLHAFQMLCPGCVHHGIPQTQKIAQKFEARSSDIIVLGIHTVFENHEVMTPSALEVFIHENRLTFPIGIDMPTEGKRIPQTMAEYGMQGTPTTILIDKNGIQRSQYFGVIDDFDLGLAIGKLLEESK